MSQLDFVARVFFEKICLVILYKIVVMILFSTRNQRDDIKIANFETIEEFNFVNFFLINEIF